MASIFGYHNNELISLIYSLVNIVINNRYRKVGYVKIVDTTKRNGLNIDIFKKQSHIFEIEVIS